MAEYVEKALSEMVPELDDLRRKRIFGEEELRLIVKRRRDYEYLIRKTEVKQQDFLGCIRYEVALECLRSRRSKNLHWRRKTVSDFAGLKRLHLIFDRAVRKFKEDLRMWYQYIDFCLRSGSTKILSRVLVRALKFHPREVHLWLLAADRELKLGHIKAARSLMTQGLRFAPTSPKLYGEFVRLEVRVACHLLDVRDSPHAEPEVEGSAAAAARKSPWAPARLLFRRAVSRLSAKPGALAQFLAQARTSLREAQNDPRTAVGLEDWAAELRAAFVQHRPGAPESADFSELPDEVVEQLWGLWWNSEAECGRSWTELVADVSSMGPPAALRSFASVLAELAVRGGDEAGVAAAALLDLAAAASVDADADTAVVVLCKLEALAANAPEEPVECAAAARKAFKNLLKRAEQRNPENGRLALAAWQPSVDSAGPSPKRRRLLADDASAMLLLRVAPRPSGDGDSESSMLENVLRGLVPGEAPGPAVTAHLAAALARGGDAELRQACHEARRVADKLWDLPRCRAAVLDSVLDCESRCGSTAL